MFDLILRNGTVVDGTGAAPFTADVGVKDGVITHVGASLDAQLANTREVIDASGHTITPGFVDVHTHYDGQATWDSALTRIWSAHHVLATAKPSEPNHVAHSARCLGHRQFLRCTHVGSSRRTADVVTAVKRQTSETAALVGLNDRGVIAVGKRADLNVIDLASLRLHRPRPVDDLPAGGRRILQGATGYAATIVDGTITRRNGADTGARPGRLLRRS